MPASIKSLDSPFIKANADCDSVDSQILRVRVSGSAADWAGSVAPEEELPFPASPEPAEPEEPAPLFPAGADTFILSSAFVMSFSSMSDSGPIKRAVVFLERRSLAFLEPERLSVTPKLHAVITEKTRTAASADRVADFLYIFILFLRIKSDMKLS